MFALIEHDLVVGKSTASQSHGIVIDDELSTSNYRFDGQKLIDATTLGFYEFYIDEYGVKHINKIDNWQSLECHYDDKLVRHDGVWRVSTPQDDYEIKYNQVDDARRNAYFQMVTPLIDEAKIKRDLIGTPESISEAEQLEQQALAARLKIQSENPWPTPPTN